MELERWAALQEELRASGTPLAMPDWPASLIATPLGFLDILGHSGIADYKGVTQPDFGAAHRLDQELQPALYRNIAMGSAIHSWHDQGNAALGDGGWAHAATEFDRGEEVAGFMATTLNGATLANASSIVVTTAGLAGPLDYLVIGKGAATEIVQISGTYVSGTTIGLQTNAVNAHASGDPVYHAVQNAGGYLAKSQVVIVDCGGNDVAYLGPRNTVSLDGLVFGTNAGAARGLDPYKHALRFSLAQMRCSVIYPDSHPSCIYSAANWTSYAVSGRTTYGATASFPPTLNFGGGNTGTVHYTTTAGSTITFSTAPDFPGGTVCFFAASYDSATPAGVSGAGSTWTYTVNGSAYSASPQGATFDTRNVNAVNFNDAAAQTTAKVTGCVYRLTGLAAGVNTIVATVGTLNVASFFLGWGIEANNPPAVAVCRIFRLGGYGVGYGYGTWATQPYSRRTPATTQTATVAINAGHLAGSVTLGTAVTIGTTGTTNAAVYPGDTITLSPGTVTEETRRVVGVDSTTTLHVDVDFAFAHTASACVIGLQDADFVGGGWANTVDAQGATSVPGLNGAMSSITSEFDKFVQLVELDAAINGGRGTFPLAQGTNPNHSNDGVHNSNAGAAACASAVLLKIQAMNLTLPNVAKTTVPNKRTWISVYGETTPTGQPPFGAGAQAVFQNSWQNFFPTVIGLGSSFARTGWYKDSHRNVHIRGAIQGGTDSTIFTLPNGYRPSIEGRVLIPGYGTAGPCLMIIVPSGNVSFAYGYPGNAAGAWAIFQGYYLAEA